MRFQFDYSKLNLIQNVEICSRCIEMLLQRNRQIVIVLCLDIIRVFANQLVSE